MVRRVLAALVRVLRPTAPTPHVIPVSQDIGAIIREVTPTMPLDSIDLVPDYMPLMEATYDLFFSHDPFDNTVEIDIPFRGDHPTLGLLLTYCDYCQRLQLKDMALSTPGSHLPKWRSTLRNAYLIKLDNYEIHSHDDLNNAIIELHKRNVLKGKLLFAMDRSYGVHPIEGIMQIHFDQMNTIAKHLEDIARDRVS
jgi:hypothetical protein